MLGIGILLGGGQFWEARPEPRALGVLLEDTAAILQARRGSPKEVEAFVGSWTWRMILSRCTLSCFGSVCPFVGSLKPFDIVALPMSVLAELQAVSDLRSYMFTDWPSSLGPTAFMTDASPSGGAVVSTEASSAAGLGDPPGDPRQVAATPRLAGCLPAARVRGGGGRPRATWPRHRGACGHSWVASLTPCDPADPLLLPLLWTPAPWRRGGLLRAVGGRGGCPHHRGPAGPGGDAADRPAGRLDPGGDPSQGPHRLVAWWSWSHGAPSLRDMVGSALPATSGWRRARAIQDPRPLVGSPGLEWYLGTAVPRRESHPRLRPRDPT